MTNEMSVGTFDSNIPEGREINELHKAQQSQLQRNNPARVTTLFDVGETV